MKRLFFNLMLITCFYPIVFGQTVKCDSISFNLVPIPEQDTALVDFKFRLKVDMVLSVRDLGKDTLKLKTGIKVAQGLGPEHLQAFLLEKNGNLQPLNAFVKNVVAAELFQDTQFLNILLPSREDAGLFVSYNVIGTGFFFYLLAQNYPSVYAFHQREEYFYPMDMPIRAMKVTAPDSILPFYSHESHADNQEEINLTFINKKYYEQEIFNSGNIEINAFIPDTLAGDSIYRCKIKELCTYIAELSSYVKDKKCLNILFLNWRDEEARRAFGLASGNYCIFDIKFPAQGMLHEVIHMAFPNEVVNGSKGEYFVKESVVEWLSLFLTGKLDSIDTSFVKENKASLFDTHINQADSWALIYTGGPAMLQNIAGQVSVKQVASAIISFFIENEGKATTYEGFVRHLQTYLPVDLVEKLDAMVKGNTPEH